MTDAEIIAANEQVIAAAHVSLDLEAIDRLYHPEFIVVQPDGMIETKPEVLASYRSGERCWDFAEVDRLHIRVTGACAVVLGRWPQLRGAVRLCRPLHLDVDAAGRDLAESRLPGAGNPGRVLASIWRAGAAMLGFRARRPS
jgi:hypothetical protein